MEERKYPFDKDELPPFHSDELPSYHGLREQVEDIQKPPELFRESIITGDRIFMMFLQIHVVLLRADVQSGKTSVCHRTIERTMTDKRLEFCYVVCGSDSIDLRNQWNDDLYRYHKHQPYYHRIIVVFRQHYHQFPLPTENTLVIVDESHLVMERDQTLAAYLQRSGFSIATETPEMKAQNNYLLSVDATPFVEMAAMSHDSSIRKKIVTHIPHSSYFGPKDYLEFGKMEPTFSTETPEGRDQFRQLIRNESFQHKYALIRISSRRNRKSAAFLRMLHDTGVPILHYDSHHMGMRQQIALTEEDAKQNAQEFRRVQTPSLDQPASQFTIVLVDGRLRCGTRVPKRHIAFTWETSESATTDILIQSLLGRMCGYKGDGIYGIDHNHLPHLFVPARLLQTYTGNTLEESELERACANRATIIPRFAKHLLAGHTQKKRMYRDAEIHQCPPFRFQLTAAQMARLNGQYRTTLQICLETLTPIVARSLYKNCIHLTLDQKQELDQAFNRREFNIIQYTEQRHARYYIQQQIAYRTNSTPLEHMERGDPMRPVLCVTFPNYLSLDPIQFPPTAGEILIVCYTYSAGLKHTINKESRIPRPDNKTHFTL